MGHSKLAVKDSNHNGDLYIGPEDETGYFAIVVRGPFCKATRGNVRERAELIVTACNQHDELKAFACKAVDYFESECDECKTESINKYGKHGTEGCKSCLTGKLLIEAKGFK